MNRTPSSRWWSRRAGWVKTSLLSRWASTAASTTPLAWVSLDENDDEPVRFWRYLLTALSEADDQLTSAALDALAAANTTPTDLALPLLINALATTPNRHVVVLDDYQAVTDRAIHESVEFFLSYLPPTAQVVIPSRWDPPLPLARMRARGELVELRANDLRLRRRGGGHGVGGGRIAARLHRRLGPVGADRRLGGGSEIGRAGFARQSGSQRGGRSGPRG
jgi:ATP/maltotriose-dependent transcriptional regulator MalT